MKGFGSNIMQQAKIKSAGSRAIQHRNKLQDNHGIFISKLTLCSWN
ncbi:hypothetical protein CCACVL1_22415 [Corchorus capsularis]|uniref:Uncharacterized protein n=1 Tax=Corchorus capsularis TaxID=210143 RepID=A0A1R3GZ44_COCAP|nr:hypothetical protein CCACVL1_22415 [Corchorus capsularis]